MGTTAGTLTAYSSASGGAAGEATAALRHEHAGSSCGGAVGRGRRSSMVAVWPLASAHCKAD
eukprot:scaffold14647_cov60-Phaeocystis_antarctica.AAC.5